MNATTGAWICYQCGESGGLSMLAEKIGGPGTNAKELIREVRRQATRRPRRLVVEPPEPVVEPESELRLQARYESFGDPPGWALEERHITREAAAWYGIKWSKGWIIPIWAPGDDHRLWGWQFKRLSMVRNYPHGIKKSTTLFGLREIKATQAVVVESPLDVVRLASAGVSAVATFGAFVSKAQTTLLIDCFEKISLALDDDETGNEQLERIYRGMARQITVQVPVFPPGAKDPGDMSDGQVAEVFGDFQRNAKTISRGRGAKDDRQRVLSAGSRHGTREDGHHDRRRRGVDRSR